MSDVINELIMRVRSRENVTSVVVTHDMTSARKVADRIVMLYPVSRLEPDEPQVVFDGTPDELDHSDDPRIRQFVEGRAGARLTELQDEQTRLDDDSPDRQDGPSRREPPRKRPRNTEDST
jgi:phospholipid/cholesterol/gamma-HCH transport system ATP-binding protein